jgi:hypothetical protein
MQPDLLREWCKRHREMLRAQLDRLNGKPTNPYVGHEYPLITNTPASRKIVETYIEQLDELLGDDNA